MSDLRFTSRSRISKRTQAIAAIALAVAGINGLVACSSDDTSTPTTDAGARDGSSDGTVPNTDSGPGPGDGGTDSTVSDGAINDGSLVLDGHTRPDTGPVETGDAGQPCTPPSNSCGPGLFCNGSKVCQPDFCSGKPQKALPYALANDFPTVFTIGPEKGNFQVLNSAAECDSTTYPPTSRSGVRTSS